MASQDLIVRLNAETGQFERGFRSAEESARALERELDRVENEQRQLASMQMAAAREDAARAQERRSAMTEVGQAAVAMGAAVAIGLGLSAKAAMDWETAWAGVRKTVDGTDEEMAALEGELRALAKVLPVTHEEIAGVAEAAGQLGIARQDVAAFTKTMIDLGVSTNLSSDEAATALARISNIMGTSAKDVGRMGASIVELGNNSATTEAEIVELSTRLAAAGRQAGLSEADVFAFAAVLTSVGVEAEAGGTAMSKVFTAIGDSVRDGGDKLETFARISGVTAAQFQQAYERDAAGAITMFVDGMGRLSASGQSTTQVFKDLELTDQRLMRAVLSVGSATGELDAKLQLSNDAWTENTALVDEANKRYQTTEARLQMARNSLNDAAIDIGANLLPALAGAAERAAALAEAFNSLPGPAKTAVTILGVVVSTALLLGGAALIAVPKLVALNAALALTGPAGAKAAAGLSKVGGILMGPWGIALAGATLALGVWAEQQFKAAQHVESLTSSLDHQTGAITESTREIVKNDLAAKAGWWVFQKDSAFDAADRLGLSLEDVTDAALGNADALARVNIELDVWRDKVQNDDATRQRDDWVELQAAIGRVDEAIIGNNETLGTASEKRRQLTDAGEGATEATEDFTAAQYESTSAVDDATDALDDLIKAMDEVNGIGRSSIAAQSDWQAAIDAASASLKENGKTLDLTKEKGRANMDALLKMADAADDTAEAILRETGSEAEMRKSLDKSRESLHLVARRFGMSKEAADKFVDSVLAVPPVAEVQAVVHTKDALDKLAVLAQRIGDLPRQRVTTVRVNEIISRGGNTGGGFSAGGRLPGGPSSVDSLLTPTAPGEWIVNAWSSAKYDEVLQAINAGTFTGVTAPSAAPAAGSTVAPMVSLDGMRIEGTLDLGNGLTGLMRGVVREESRAQGRAYNSRKA